MCVGGRYRIVEIIIVYLSSYFSYCYGNILEDINTVPDTDMNEDQKQKEKPEQK